jgi:hypothetical protein
MPFIGQTIGISSSPDLLLKNIDCDSAISPGDWVRWDDTGTLIIKAQADSLSNSNVLGVVEDKSSSTVCTIRVGGISKELFLSLDVTKKYFLDPVNPGQMTTVVPIGSGQIVLCLGQPVTDKKFLVEKNIRLQRAI